MNLSKTNFSNSDDIFTIKLPSSDLIFTRYLYIKDEVIITLLVSILNKSDDSIFWAYELYYSGFKHELFYLIWKIYYDFFATLNPTYEAYLFKKHNQWLLNENDLVIGSIIQDLLFRPFNTDVFNIRNICEQFELDIEYHTNIIDALTLQQNMTNWILNEDFRSISQWILNVNTDINIIDIYIIFLDTFFDIFTKLTNNKIKLLKDINYALKLSVNPKIILIAKIMTLFSRKYDLKKGKIVYIKFESEDIIPYETIEDLEDLKGYNILKEACKYNIDNFKHLSLFKLTRHNYNLSEKYWYNWEYHSSFSPIWSKRIKQFKGYPDYTSQKIIFNEYTDDELMQEFYIKYGLEPDEQPKEVQDKSIQIIENVYNWKWFNNKYKNNGIFNIYEEELEEFDICKLKYKV
jgi:hypothetical protein